MTHLREIIVHLADAGVDYVIGGGVACVLQGGERFTFTCIDLKDPRRHVDLFLRDDPSSEVLADRCDVADLDGRMGSIASAEKLLEIKKSIDPPREKDLLDIAAWEGCLDMDEQTRQIIEKSSASDFAGHTEFSRMTPAQRLAGLDEANAAYLELHGLDRVAEEQSPYGTRKEAFSADEDGA